jgi:hypothetical protein
MNLEGEGMTMSENKIWNREQIEALLNANDIAVERGIVAIYERQTADEKVTETTNHHNNIGFAGWGAKKGTYYAKWILSGRRLTGRHLENARKIALFHASQLTKIANKEI